MNVLKKLNPLYDEHRLALKDWLTGKASGHLGPYMYIHDHDDKRWKDAHSSEKYYVGQDDKATFDLMVRNVNALAETVFDLGPGGVESINTKTLPIIEATMAANYVAVDLSPALANIAAEQVAQKLPIKSSTLVTNFFDGFPVTEANIFIALMGGTLGNLETHHNIESLKKRLIRIFRNYRRSVLKSGFFLASFDANRDVKEIVQCYDNPELAQLIKNCVGESIDTDDFEYHVKWSPENYQLALGLRSKRDQRAEYDGTRFAIERGEFLPVLNSYRYPVRFVIDAAAESGWKHWKTWSATGRIHYLLFVAD